MRRWADTGALTSRRLTMRNMSNHFIPIPSCGSHTTGTFSVSIVQMRLPWDGAGAGLYHLLVVRRLHRAWDRRVHCTQLFQGETSPRLPGPATVMDVDL